MKFKKNRTYDAIYISDIHYLLNKKIKNHRHQDLFALFYFLRKRGVRFRKLYLVGDVIENWFFDAQKKIRKDKKQKKRLDKLFDRLEQIVPPDGKKYFVVGNHDTTAFTMELSPELESYLKKRNWRIGERFSHKNVVVLHGHQGQYTKITWALNILILRCLHVLALFIPDFFHVMENFYDRHLNRQDPATPEEKLAYYRRLSHISDQGSRVLISGHTHDFLCLPEFRIINTGDWVKSRTFVIQDGRKWIGVKMKDYKEYDRVFTLKLN
jgi:UDP-2,3-diacylglucosamine pyrophosphatase LpxH